MKVKKKIAILGVSLLILSGVLSTTYAYSYVSGTQYQYASHVDIPSRGRPSYQTNYGSKKATTGELATFKATFLEAWLGNFANLIDVNKKDKSAEVGLSTSTAKVTSEFGCSKGNVYFSAVMSSGFEPSNTCDVRIAFSADNLKF